MYSFEVGRPVRVRVRERAWMYVGVRTHSMAGKTLAHMDSYTDQNSIQSFSSRVSDALSVSIFSPFPPNSFK